MRDAAINLRALPQQRDLIDQAVQLLGTNRSDFMLKAACDKAQSVLLDLGHPTDQTVAVWSMPLSEDQVRALVAPDLLPHLPYLVALGIAFLLLKATPRGIDPGASCG